MEEEDDTPITIEIPRDKRVTVPETPMAKSREPRDTVPPPIGKKKVPAPVWMTLIAGVMTTFFEYRTQMKTDQVVDKTEVVEAKTEVSYDTLAPLVRDLQEQQKVMAAQLDLLREIALANNRAQPPLTARSSPSQQETAARTEATVDLLQRLPPTSTAASAKPPPATLDAAAAAAP